MDFLVAHFQQLFFYAIALLTVLGAIGVVVCKNVVHSAMSLLGTFLLIAALFVLRQAEFLAAVQIMVYAGGILVLFLFVIMLVNVRRLQPEQVFLSRHAPVAILAGVLLGALLTFGVLAGSFAAPVNDSAALRTVEPVVTTTEPGAEPVPQKEIQQGNTEAVGWVLYRTYLVPFEVVSMVLLVAMIAAIVYGRREDLEAAPDAAEGSSR